MEPALRYDEAELLRRLERIPPLDRARFAQRCALRWFPRYEALAAVSASADVETMRLAMAQLASGLRGERAVDLRELIERCLALVPDDDDEIDAPPLVVALADAAAAALVYALSCYQSGAAQDAAWAARRAYEAADVIAVEDLDIDLNSPGAEERILAHEAVQRELAAQEQDLREVGG